MPDTTPETEALPDLWLVITNAMSWGKGSSAKEAIDNAIGNAVFLSAPRDVVCHVYYWKDATPELVKAVQVDGLGGFSYPKDRKPDRSMVTPNALTITQAQVKARTAWQEVLEDLVYAPDFDKAFDGNT